MSGSDVHIVPDGDSWAVKKPGAKRASAILPTQAEAIARGRELARKERSELVIHRRDGRIRDKDSYGNDPNPPRDTKH